MAMAKLTSVKVGLQLPYLGSVEGTWEPDEEERKAAWEMYVELVTRISVMPLQPEEGSLREALSSLYSLFSLTREILRAHGPSVARAKKDELSFGYLAVAILNTVLRPLLTKWHPVLKSYEETRLMSVSPLEHERKWVHFSGLRQEIESARQILIQYANLLAQVAEVPLMIVQPPTQEHL